jgi:hypothetical protein
MTKIKNTLLICDFAGCNKYFKEPITLPYGDTVCKEHLNPLDTSLKCPICAKEFLIPEEGFSINKKINDFISENSHLTGPHREVKDVFDQLEKEIENFQ